MPLRHLIALIVDAHLRNQ